MVSNLKKKGLSTLIFWSTVKIFDKKAGYVSGIFFRVNFSGKLNKDGLPKSGIIFFKGRQNSHLPEAEQIMPN